MKDVLILIVILLLPLSILAQNLTESTFDFWIGNWEISWVDKDGNSKKGVNEIQKIIDDKVIQERFDAVGFKGTSISVFNSNTKEWHQAWADNQGGYFDFIGGYVENSPSFMTQQALPNGDKVKWRMVFKNINTDSFLWDWQKSTDDGNTWVSTWVLNYKRKD